MIQVQKAFIGASVPNFVSEERVFVKEGTFLKRTGYGPLKPRWFFLFSDCLVYGKSTAPEKGKESDVNLSFDLVVQCFFMRIPFTFFRVTTVRCLMFQVF